MKRRWPSSVAAGSLLLVFLAAWSAPAAAQGVVLAPGSAPPAVERVRALLVFQDFGGFGDLRARAADNREDLLVEVELAAPAPGGAAWVLSAPGQASARPGDPAVLEEMSAYWRRARRNQVPLVVGEPPLAPAPPLWPEPEAEAASSPDHAEVSGPMDSSALKESLESRGIALPGTADRTIARQAAAGWSFFLAEVPAGARRIAVHLSFKSEIAFYPGALGADGSIGPIGRMGPVNLPPLELMVLHPHFVNVDDNSAGLKPRLGLLKVYQDSGTLQDGGQLWADPAGSRTGPVRDSVGELRAVAGFMTAAAPEGRLFLTALAGAPGAEKAEDLDFGIRSHYPSAVETLPAGRSLAWLAAVSVLLVVLAGWLLKKKGFAQ